MMEPPLFHLEEDVGVVMKFERPEMAALCLFVKRYREKIGEDTIGALMHCGAFKLLDEEPDSLVTLAAKIDVIIADLESMKDTYPWI